MISKIIVGKPVNVPAKESNSITIEKISIIFSIESFFLPFEFLHTEIVEMADIVKEFRCANK